MTVDGCKYATFKEAAEKHGLLEQDGYAESCMTEAAQVQLPHALRRLFSMLLLFCEPENPRALWDKFYVALSEDFKHRYPISDATVLQLTAAEVGRYLEGMGKSLQEYNLHHLLEGGADTITITRDISDALTTPIPTAYLSASKTLNHEQRLAYKCIMHHVKAKKGVAFFIDGPGGTGKTFLYCTLYAKVRSMGKIVLPTATSGIDASNMPTCRTTHSRFKIPIDDDHSLTCNISKQSSLAQLLKEAALIIWDEASMTKKDVVEALDALLRDICGNQNPFGGKVIVFGGDFRQVLPVLPKKTQEEAVDASVVSSYLWPHFIKFRLDENIRARDDPEFASFLLQLGNGALQSKEQDYIELPSDIVTCLDNIHNPFDMLAYNVFPEMKHMPIDVQIFADRAILTPTNENVDQINESLIMQFNGTPFTYKSFDSVIDDSCNIYPTEFLNTLCPSGMSTHELILKENCPVILLRNLDPVVGLCNGTRLICKKFFVNIIECEITTGYNKGEHIFLPRITLRPPSSPKCPFIFQRKQFPIKLCFAMTINKAQGQTLQRVAIYLRQPCFSHGQLYVALSRATNRKHVNLLTKATLGEPSGKILVQNVLSFEMLRRAGII